MDTLELLSEISVLKERLSKSVEVVRCRECKWLKMWDDGEQTCRRIGVGYIVGDDYFCRYGERRRDV